MSIQKISKEQLRRMGNQEGLILQGCGGDPQEWLDGINQILTEEGILKKGARFEKAYTFQHDGVTCLVFPFKEGMAIEMGRLAMWRLQTHPHFGGTWLSDYVPNRLGGFLQEQEQRMPRPVVFQTKYCGRRWKAGHSSAMCVSVWTTMRPGKRRHREFPKH